MIQFPILPFLFKRVTLVCGLFFALLFTSQIALGQSSNVVVHFASDSTVFFNQLDAFMKSAREKEGKEFMKEFELYWYGGRFDDEQRKAVYSIANLMLKARKRAFPDFRDYFYSVLGFLDSPNQRPQNFFVWSETLEQFLKNKARKEFGDYLSFSLLLFEENVLAKSKASTWVADNDNYIFEFDSLPKLTFEALTLTCYAKSDSAVIHNTSGTYYPTSGVWVGEKGVIDWLRAGFKTDRVYATFNSYQLNTSKTEFTVDTVIFYNKNYFGEEPLAGTLYEKVLAPTKSKRVSYPRFESFNRRLGIKNIAEAVDYDGGFAMYGESFIGKGTVDEPAKLIFFREGKPFLVAISENFNIKKDRITSDDAAIRMYLQEDSIYHSGLLFKFFIETRTVTLLKDGSKSSSLSPYYNTFHMIDMDFEVLNWKVEDPVIEFTNIQGTTKREALFESASFFSFSRYNRFQGMAHTNPLVQIRALSIKMDDTHLTLSDLARFMKMPSNQIEQLLMDLHARGMVSYNYGTKEFDVNERLFNYVYSRTGKRDYDIIQFYSSVNQGNNASLNLQNLDLTINGIDNIFLSDSQQVVIFPAGREIVMKKNRDFIFAGVVKAGRLDFFGKEFSFEYYAFKVNLTNVDSLRMKAELPEIDEYGKKRLTTVRSVIEGINGELLIDRPDNKSGRQPSPEYPIFNSHKDSYVYYNKREVLNGAYKKEDLFFHLEPFTIDSVDNFTNKGLRFEGKFESNGIFPVFEETLALQPDYSLGFVRKAPPEGFPVYNGKGHFYDDINLSNKGLRGDGKLDYLTSTTLSEDFVFYPDSMVTIADSYAIEARESGVEFPPVQGGGVKVSWLPEADVMYTDELDSALAFYDGESFLHGRTTLKPEGLSGSGIFEFERAELESDVIKFKFKEFDSDTADFRLKDLELAGELTFTTTNVNAHIDFEKRVGQFKSNGGGSFIEFPANQYVSFMEEFNWYMDTEDIELSAGESDKNVAATDSSDVKLEGAEFVSIHPEQDSLNFFSTLAKYDLRKKIISAKGVKYINTADARVIPDSGQVIVRKNAVMDPLNKAGIIANNVTKYHNIYNATVNIYGKRSYAGSGYIDYVDELGKPQALFLEKISVDTTMQTVAFGTVESGDAFTLSPYFEFRGKVEIQAKNQFLTFTGATRISHECEVLKRNWIDFTTEVDPNAIYIPIGDDLRNQAGSKLLSSIMLGGDSSGIYSGFLIEQPNNRDIKVLPATGFLFYDKPTKEYRISNKDKLGELSFPGNYLSLKTTSCKVYGEGIVDPGADLGQIGVRAAGNVIHTLTDNEVILDLFMILDFHMAENALEEMAKTLNANIALDPVKLDRPSYEKSLKELLGKETSDKLISDIGLYGNFKKFPSELNTALVLNEARFKFNEESNSYRSFGRIGISNILKEQINKYVVGKMEIVKRRSGDLIEIYLEAGNGNWYFFSYTRGIMYTVSSSDSYNTIIKEVKPDKAKVDTKKKETPYKFIITTERKKNDFLKRFDIE
jgi:hypothetical protein